MENAENRNSKSGTGQFGAHLGEVQIPSFREVCRVLFRRKWLILVTFFGISAVGVGASLIAPDMYESTGSLLLKAEVGDMSFDPTARGGIMTAAPARNAPENEISILQSLTLSQEVAAAVGPEKILMLDPKKSQASAGENPEKVRERQVKAAAGAILKDLTAGSNDSAVLWVKYQHRDAKVATSVIQSLMELYIERHKKVYSSATSPEMIQTLADGVAKDIAEKEAAIKKYEDEHGGGSLTDKKAALQSMVRATDSELADTTVAKNASQARIDALAASISGKDSDGDTERLPTEVENPVYSRLSLALEDAELRKIQAETRYADESKEMKIIVEEIGKIKQKMSGVPKTVPRAQVAGTADGAGMDPAIRLDNERVNFKSLESTEHLLQTRLATTKDELRSLEAIEEPVVKMETELIGMKDNYANLLKSVRDSQVLAELDKSAVSNVKIVQPATQPDRPSGPRRVRNVALALFAGMVIGIGLGFVREFFDDTVKSREDVEKKLGLTVLAVVPAEEFRECI